MNELTIFNNPEFGEIRTVRIDGKPYAVGADIARALGYAKPQNAIATHCKGALKRGIPTKGGTQEMLVIPKGDIYRLAANSGLPSAERFEGWIFDEVLISIDEHGAYMTPAKIEEVLLNPDTIIQLAMQLKSEREHSAALEQTVQEMRPKALFADAVETSHNSILIGDLAKLLKQNGEDIGQNRLFERLRNEGYLCSRHGDQYNAPTQRSMELGLFEVRVRTINNPDGSVRTTRTTKVTGKGQIYFINKYCGKQGHRHIPSGTLIAAANPLVM